MLRLSLALGRLLFFLALSSAAVAAEVDGIFYINGVNSADGMSTRIDLEAGYIRVAGERFRIENCAPNGGRGECMSTGYFELSLSAVGTLDKWISVSGTPFFDIGECDKGSGQPGRVRRVLSPQRHGIFEFLISTSDLALHGWRLYLVDLQGVPSIETWLREGESYCLGNLSRYK